MPLPFLGLFKVSHTTIPQGTEDKDIRKFRVWGSRGLSLGDQYLGFGSMVRGFASACFCLNWMGQGNVIPLWSYALQSIFHKIDGHAFLLGNIRIPMFTLNGHLVSLTLTVALIRACRL